MPQESKKHHIWQYSSSALEKANFIVYTYKAMAKVKIKSKHKQFVNSLVKNLKDKKYSATQSYMEVYVNSTPESACANASDLLNRPEVIDDLTVKLNRAGLDLNTLSAELKSLVKANRLIITKQGMIKTEDNATRTENLKTAFKLHKVLGSSDGKLGDTINIDARQLTVGSSDVQALDKLCGRIDSLNDNLKQSRARRDRAKDV